MLRPAFTDFGTERRNVQGVARAARRVDDGRPITNGIIMWGKTTTSRSGTIGSVSYTSNGDSIYPAFSMSAIGLSFAITTSRVMVTSRTFLWFGT